MRQITASPLCRSRALNNDVGILAGLDPRAALEAVGPGVSLASRIGDKTLMDSFRATGAFACIATGDWDQGIKLLEDDLDEGGDELSRLKLLQVWLPLRAYRGEDVATELDWLLEHLAMREQRILQTQIHDTKARIELGDRAARRGTRGSPGEQ